MDAFNLGVALYDSGQYEDALKHFDQALKQNPQFAPAYNFKGLILNRLGQYEDALMAFDEAVRLNPQDTDVHNNRGVALENLKRNEEAVKAFDEVLRLDPRNAYAYGNKGSVLRRLGRYEEALLAVDAAIRLDAQRADDQYTRGLVLCELRRDEEALRAFEAVVQAVPNHVAAHHNRGVVLSRLGRYKEAIYVFKRALKLHPEHAGAHYGKGRALHALGKHIRAVWEYDKVLRIQPHNGKAQYERGIALQALGLWEEAVKAFDEAIRRNLKQACVYTNQGFALWKLGNYDEALRSVDEAIRLDANYAPAYINKGNILSALGQYEEALCAFDEALRLAPNDPDAVEKRSGIERMIRKLSVSLASLEPVFPAPIPDNVLGDGTQTGGTVQKTQDYLFGGVYILGGNRAERVSLLTDIVRKQAQKNEPLLVFDSNGDLINEIIKHLPANRLGQTYILDITDREYPLSLNIFSSYLAKDKDKREIFAKFLIKWFARLWPEIGEYLYLENLLHYVIVTLGESQTISLGDLPRFLLDPPFRESVVKGLRDRRAQDFWMQQYGNSENQKSMENLFLQRIDSMLHERILELCLCQRGQCVDLPSAMSQNEILLVKLPVEGYEFADAAKMIGGLLLTLVQCIDSFSSDRRSVTVVLDEFQHFCTDDFERLFAGQESKVKLIFAQQSGYSLHKEEGLPKRSTILSAHTVVSFRATPDDASELTRKVFAGVKRRGTKIYAKVLERMERHPYHAVKDFYLRYVTKLEDVLRKQNCVHTVNYKDGDVYYYCDFGYGNVTLPYDYTIRVITILETLNAILYRAQETQVVYEYEKRELLLSWMRLVGGIQLVKEKKLDIDAQLEQEKRNLEDLQENRYDVENTYSQELALNTRIINSVYGKLEKGLSEKLEEAKEKEKRINSEYDEQRGKVRNDIFTDEGFSFSAWGVYIPFDISISSSEERIKYCMNESIKRARWWNRKELKQIWEDWIEHKNLFYATEKQREHIDTLFHKKFDLEREKEHGIYKAEKKYVEKLASYAEKINVCEREIKRLEKSLWVDVEKLDEQFVAAFDNMLAALISDPIASDSNESIEGHLMELPNNHAYVKVGTTTSFMKLNTLSAGVSEVELKERKQRIVTQSRQKYARPRREVEEEIAVSFQ